MSAAQSRRFGVDIVGFGPIGRRLAQVLATDSELKRKFLVASISDSSGSFFPKSSSIVLHAVEWKEGGKKVRELEGAKSVDAIKESDASISIDLTNSDYSKFDQARKRAESTLNSGKHLVFASKVALSFYFSEISSIAKRRGLLLGSGATICGGRNAITIAKNIGTGEIKTASAVLNASTTKILSSLEENISLTFEDACNIASKAGILESDWSVDLDGIDAAAKTAILANFLFPKSKLSFRDVKRSGIREKNSEKLIDSVRRSRNEKRIRLISEIDGSGRASVAPKLIEGSSVLAVEGRFNAVSMETKTLGEISVRSLGGGVDLTSSVIISDLKMISEKSIQ